MPVVMVPPQLVCAKCGASRGAQMMVRFRETTQRRGQFLCPKCWQRMFVDMLEVPA